LQIALAAAAAFIAVCIALAVHFTRSGDNPGDSAAVDAPTALELTVAKEPAKTDPQERQRREEEKRWSDYDRLLAQGNRAFAEQRYDDAVAAYEEALKTNPQGLDAAKGINLARTALASKSADLEEKEKRKTEFARRVDEAKKAIADKQLGQAVRSLESALQMMDDADAKKLLDETRQQLAENEQEKKKLADYEKYLAAGRAALVAGRYADAVREFTAALNVIPNDAAALDGRRQAEQRIVEENNEEKKKASFNQAIAVGNAALKARRYEEAAQAFQLAAKLNPSDKTAQDGLRQANQGLQASQGQLNTLMAQAQAASALGRWEESLRLYQEAARLFPNNPQVIAALRNAERMTLDAQAAQAAYIRWMQQAGAAMQLGRYDEAARCYTEALRLFPADRDANLGLRQAQTFLEREVGNRQLYNQAMQRALNLAKQGKFQEAARCYQDALELSPGDPEATAGLRQARYAQYMSEGEANMRARRYTSAIRDFENALRERPGDPAASRSLAQARALAAKK
jgi:tetratricopeptide (TPR) repeat protein